MVISSKFLDALTPSSIRSITAKIRDKAKDGIQVVSFAGGLPSKEFFPLEDLRRIMKSYWIYPLFAHLAIGRGSNMPPLTATTPCVSIWWSL